LGYPLPALHVFSGEATQLSYVLGIANGGGNAICQAVGTVSTSEEKRMELIQVESYSGYKANERPTLFFLRSTRVRVVDIIDRWYGTDHDFFKVLADDGRVYLLKWQRFTDEWFLVKVVERARTHFLFS
jgi:hypothetical protein